MYYLCSSNFQHTFCAITHPSCTLAMQELRPFRTMSLQRRWKIPTYLGKPSRMLEQLDKENCRLILAARSIEPVRKCPVVVREKWYRSPNNQRTMIELLRRGFMFQEDRMQFFRQAMLFMLRHNKLHVDVATLKEKKHRHNTMRQMFYNYVCRASRGGPKDKDIPVEVS